MTGLAAGGALYLALLAAPIFAADPAALANRYTASRTQLEASPLGRPILLQSSETADGLKGDVFAVLDHPLPEIVNALASASQWCAALMLHINNRECRVSTSSTGNKTLTLSVVRRFDQPVTDAFILPFTFQTIEASPRHLEVNLDATIGPLGTNNYRIRFDAVPIDSRRSYMHFSYAYDEGTLAKAGMKVYLATFGRSKVGFTETGRLPDGQQEYIGGTRGLMERNAMRYFLTVEAYLGATGDPLAQRRSWHQATERYPRQLHEVGLAAYLELKASNASR